jgi:hypothetical protein
MYSVADRKCCFFASNVTDTTRKVSALKSRQRKKTTRMTLRVYGQIWYRKPDAYRARTQEGWNAIRNADGPRAFQNQMLGKMRGRRHMNHKGFKMATNSVSGIRSDTTFRGWTKNDLDRLDAFSATIPQHLTRD